MQFQKLTAPSLKELFVHEMEKHIISGEFKIGDKLPSERELAESMQISRAVVNAGIAELSQKGFIEVRARSGNYVADYRNEGTLDTLVSLMNYNSGTLPDDDVRSILQLRIALSNLSTYLIINNSTDEQLQELIDFANSGKKLHSTTAIVDHTYQSFHKIAVLSGNTLLPLLVCSFKEIICNLTKKYLIKYGPSDLINDKIKYAELLATRDYTAVKEFIESLTQESIHGEKNFYYN